MHWETGREKVRSRRLPWHSSQGMAACLPLSGKAVRRWASGPKLACWKELVSWQRSQRWPSRWACTSRWQAAQARGTGFTKLLAGWQAAQVTSRWRPVSGKPVLSWEKLTFFQPSAVWQKAQRVSPPCSPGGRATRSGGKTGRAASGTEVWREASGAGALAAGAGAGAAAAGAPRARARARAAITA
jgi:hypothetical protein